MMRHSLSAEGQTTGERREWDDKPFQFQVRCTCYDCQHGWMADLEELAKPVLIPMIEGRGRTLYENGRETVAAWAIKTAMSFEGAKPYESIPLDHWRHMAAKQSPPRNTQVWLGAVEDASITPSVAYHWHNGLTLQDSTAYAATISVGHMAMLVFGIGAKDPMIRELDGWSRESLVEIWPAQGEGGVKWPPGLILDIPRLRVLGSAEFAAGD
jgi:hypothetical protein